MSTAPPTVAAATAPLTDTLTAVGSLCLYLAAALMAITVLNGHKGPGGLSRRRRVARVLVVAVSIFLSALIVFSVTGTFDVYYKVRDLAADEHTSLRSGSGIAKFCCDLQGIGQEKRFQVLLLIVTLYLFLQTFCVPGTVVLNAAVGAVLGTLVGVPVCTLLGTLGASSCYLLSKLVGVTLVEAADSRLMKGRGVPYIRAQVHRYHQDLFVYMLFLRLTPILPNWLVNLASPVVGVPLKIFAGATCLGIVPQTYLTVRFGAIARSTRGKNGEKDANPRIVTPWDTLLLAVVGVAILVAFRLRKRFKAGQEGGPTAVLDGEDLLSGTAATRLA